MSETNRTPYFNAKEKPHTSESERKQVHPRINMAFYGDNLDYVREAAYQQRTSVTEYVNRLIHEDRKKNEAQVRETAKLYNKEMK